MPTCSQAQSLLSRLKMLKEQLLQEWRIPTSPTASLGTSANSDFAKASSDRREWREKRNDDWYSQLRATSYQLKAKIKQLESLISVTETEAEHILREKQLFLGSEAVKELFDVELKPADIPPIPFSKKELKKAAEQGLVLMLVINQDQAGNPLTAKRIGEITPAKLKTVDPAFQKLFYDTAKYQDEPFYATNTPLATLQENSITARKATAAPAQWILISKETLLNSSSKNFLEQTFLLAQHLEDNILPQIKNHQRRQPYLEALAELAAKRATLEAQLALFNFTAWNPLTDEQKIQLAKSLTNLKINQLTRPDFATIIYLQVMYLKAYHQYLLTNKYTQVNETSTTLPGRLVYIDHFNHGDVNVTRRSPTAHYDRLGVSFISSL